MAQTGAGKDKESVSRSADEQLIRVSVPARSGFIHLFRTVVASAAERAGLPYDDIEDLRLAVHEASADLLALRGGATTLTLRVAALDGDLEVAVWADAEASEWPKGPPDRLTWRVLSTLTDEASMVREGDAPGIRLLKRARHQGSG